MNNQPQQDPFAHIHPDLQPLARRTPAFTFNRKTLWLVRLMSYLSRPTKIPSDVLVENRRVPRVDGQGAIRVRFYRPRTTAVGMPLLIWHHGGGYVMGRPEMDDWRCLRFVRDLGLAVFSVDYRFAPKHPFPAGLEDSYTVLQWVQSHASTMNLDASKIAVGGTSAGGGLAAALAQWAHDRQEVPLIFQLLIYPMLDDRTVTRTPATATHPVWNQQSNQFGWESYLGQQKEEPLPYAVPARRANLAGLPPAWLGVGTADLFHDENVAYAERLRASGVACELEVVSGAFHGFDALDHQSPLAEAFQQAQINAMRRYLALN